MVRKMEALESRQLASPVHDNPNLEQLYNLCEKKAMVRNQEGGGGGGGGGAAQNKVFHTNIGLISCNWASDVKGD